MPARDDLAVLVERLGVPLGHEALRHALTHRSYAYEHGAIPHNERLEFLGDAVLGLVVTDTLFRTHPHVPESQLAKYRSAVVNARTLAEVARELAVGDHLLLGRGEEATGGRDKGSILADAVEAIIGVTYVECGLDAAARLVHELLDARMERAAGLGAGLDWKTSLQELGARTGTGVPVYVVQATGPDHAKHFHAVVTVGDCRGEGEGGSKKHAEQLAAAAAYGVLAAAHPDAVR
ncbi:MAG TPA: ribonuclease III [Candidatus Nanopelagicales bacterium]